MSLMKKRLDQINTECDRYLFEIEQDTGKREVMLHWVRELTRINLTQHTQSPDNAEWWQVENESVVL
mgnify:FL=1